MQLNVFLQVVAWKTEFDVLLDPKLFTPYYIIPFIDLALHGTLFWLIAYPLT
jgi:hypothetical protein